MNRLLGKRPAVHDPRVMRLRDVLIKVPPTMGKMNWRADSPAAGVNMLGNNIAGNCVWCTGFHWIEQASLYTGQPLPSAPTTNECLAAYAAGTGYNSNDPSTDNGTVVMGPGGMVEFWTKTGLLCGGKRNFLTSAATVNIRDPLELQIALSLGPVMVGASLSQANVDADYVWVAGGPPIGGHEFMVQGCEILSNGDAYFDVETWDGQRRYGPDFAAQNVDEAVMVLDEAFFDKAGFDPAGIDMAAVQAAMASIAA
jgi:hypothetical protein